MKTNLHEEKNTVWEVTHLGWRVVAHDFADASFGIPYEHSAGRSFKETRGSYAPCLDHVLLQSTKSK